MEQIAKCYLLKDSSNKSMSRGQVTNYSKNVGWPIINNPDIILQ